MKPVHSCAPLSIRQNIGLGVAMGLGSSLGFAVWFWTISYLLIKPAFWGLDVLSIGALVIVVAAAFFAHNRTNRWAMIQTLPAERRPAPAKGPTWVAQIRESAWVSWAMLAFGLAAYLITVGGLVMVVLVARSQRPEPRYILPTVLYAAFAVWSIMIWSLGTGLLRALTRRWGLNSHPSTDDPEGAGRLWDRDLDHEFATESRPVS